MWVKRSDHTVTFPRVILRQQASLLVVTTDVHSQLFLCEFFVTSAKINKPISGEM